MATKDDRRKKARIKDKGIAIQLKTDGLGIITQSLDVSASGIYCKVKEHIPVMTKLKIVLALPGKESSPAPVLLDIEGVVVREHPVIRDGKVQHHDVAIFFNNLTPKDRDRLVRYISKKTA